MRCLWILVLGLCWFLELLTWISLIVICKFILSLSVERLWPWGREARGNNMTSTKSLKKAKKEVFITPYKIFRTQEFFLPIETFSFYSLFLFISLVRKEIHAIIKSDTTKINKTKITTLLTYHWLFHIFIYAHILTHILYKNGVLLFSFFRNFLLFI